MILHYCAQAIEIVTTLLAVAGMGYFIAAMIAARAFLKERRAPLAQFTPGVSILKSLKGLDPAMIEGFRSHCRQTYGGEYELLFGVSSLSDPAVKAVEQLKREFPGRRIELIECPARLGSNGKVSTLTQLAPHARYEFLLVNDSDIIVSTRYLERVMALFAPPKRQRTDTEPVGLVTALYRGRAHGTLPSKLEALGIATDFQAGVLLSKTIEGGIRYGLGSTLAVRRAALDKIGGFGTLVDYLADDYELGARVAQGGYRVALSSEVVETSVPAYAWSGFIDHQLRWMRTVRDSRPWGYAGLIFTHGIGWAVVNVAASGFGMAALWLLALSLCLRFALATMVGSDVLSDRQVLPAWWLLPFRDLVAMGIWAAGFAGNTIVWRGERFLLKDGKLLRTDEPETEALTSTTVD